MPWISTEHRCALPAIPANAGPGSRWVCGDVGTDTCGRVWLVQWNDELDELRFEPETETPVTGPSTAVEPLNPTSAGATDALAKMIVPDFAGGGIRLG